LGGFADRAERLLVQTIDVNQAAFALLYRLKTSPMSWIELRHEPLEGLTTARARERPGLAKIRRYLRLRARKGTVSEAILMPKIPLPVPAYSVFALPAVRISSRMSRFGRLSLNGLQ
jgi:hypothetical protein